MQSEPSRGSAVPVRECAQRFAVVTRNVHGRHCVPSVCGARRCTGADWPGGSPKRHELARIGSLDHDLTSLGGLVYQRSRDGLCMVWVEPGGRVWMADPAEGIDVQASWIVCTFGSDCILQSIEDDLRALVRERVVGSMMG